LRSKKSIATFGKIANMELQKLFSDLLIRIGFPMEAIAIRWNELENAYSHKSRKYHNLEHLKEMIASFHIYNKELTFPDEVLYAIFYHDYMYKSTKKDNELKSAQYAVKIIPSDCNTINKERVFNLIMSTKDHHGNENSDQKWLIDFDLKILAKEWEDYAVYVNQIREEYNIYPDFLYKPGRRKAMEHFLENDFIYQTDTFRTLYEAKARENILTEIKLLN
jgi:predicted metal-dependent HD superfamily phosphohydrolase